MDTVIILYLLVLLQFFSAATSTSASHAKFCDHNILPRQERDTIIRAFTRERVVPDLIACIEPRMAVSVRFTNASVQLGNTLPVNATQNEPTFNLSPLQGALAEQTNYTIIFLDADNPETWKIPTVFYLGIDYKPTCLSSEAAPPNALIPWNYAPDPLGNAPHRYCILVYLQSRTPMIDVGPGVSGRYTFPLVEFVKYNGLELVGGNFFKENGLG